MTKPLTLKTADYIRQAQSEITARLRDGWTLHRAMNFNYRSGRWWLAKREQRQHVNADACQGLFRSGVIKCVRREFALTEYRLAR